MLKGTLVFETKCQNILKNCMYTQMSILCAISSEMKEKLFMKYKILGKKME